MDPKLRAAFNADFTSEKYAAQLRCVNESDKWPADFRISETPIFLTREFVDEVTRAADEIVAATRTMAFMSHAASAIPKGLEVPNESAHPNFLLVDFAICAEGDQLVPRLIELQAFPSLFGFQLLLLGCVRKAYPIIPRNWTSSFGGIEILVRRIQQVGENAQRALELFERGRGERQPDGVRRMPMGGREGRRRGQGNLAPGGRGDKRL